MPIRVTPLSAREDARGASFSIDVPFPSVGECHLATIRPGAIRGNHFHTQRRELLAVLYTDRWTLLWDEGDGTPVQSQTFEGSGAVPMEADALCAHAVRNDGAAELQIFVLGDVRAEDTRRREIAVPLARLAGVDGCEDGWLAVIRTGASLDVRVYESADELAALIEECAVVAIDIPIGLAPGGRACDFAARRKVEPLFRSVFRAPIREALHARTRAEADAISRKLDECGMSAQTWGIAPIGKPAESIRPSPKASAVFASMRSAVHSAARASSRSISLAPRGTCGIRPKCSATSRRRFARPSALVFAC